MKPIKIGPMYYVFWVCVEGHCDQHRAPARHKASLHTSDKREAKALIADLERELASNRARVTLGLSHIHQTSHMTLEMFRGLYLTSVEHDKAVSTRKTEAGHLSTLISHLGDIPLSDLTQETLEKYKRKRLGQIAPRSWNSELGTFKAIFAWGLTRNPKLYQENPFDVLSSVPKGEPTIQKYITHADLAKVVKGCRDLFWVNTLAFLYATWCRGGELRKLEWKSVHWDEGYIDFLGPKEKKSKRVAITPELQSILETAKRLAGESPYVFPGRDGGMMTKNGLHHKLVRLGEAVGVKLAPHMLRHSGITDALKGGAQIFSVQSVAGHRQITTTQGYNHSDLDAQRAAMGTLNVAGLLESHVQENRT